MDTFGAFIEVAKELKTTPEILYHLLTKNNLMAIPINSENKSDKPNNSVQCVYGDKCNKDNCSFVHKNKEHGTSPKPKSNKILKCKFGNSCNNKDCSFSHENNTNDRVNDIKDNNFKGKNKVSKNSECRYGVSCNKKDCTYSHKNIKESNFKNVRESNVKIIKDHKQFIKSKMEKLDSDLI